MLSGDTTALPPQQEKEKNPRNHYLKMFPHPVQRNYNQTAARIKEVLLPCVRISNKTLGLILNYSLDGHENLSVCFLLC